MRRRKRHYRIGWSKGDLTMSVSDDKLSADIFVCRNGMDYESVSSAMRKHHLTPQRLRGKWGYYLTLDFDNRLQHPWSFLRDLRESISHAIAEELRSRGKDVPEDLIWERRVKKKKELKGELALV